jgi:hypothetical protein
MVNNKTKDVSDMALWQIRLEWDVHKQRSHQRAGPQAMMSIEAVLN